MPNEINFDGFEWKSEPPADCPFEASTSLKKVFFTGRCSDYYMADTVYPTWAEDGHLYTPYTDGVTDGVRVSSGGGLETGFMTGHAVLKGESPLDLEIKNTSQPKKALAAPYRGRYPCGSLIHNGIWYHGTYCLGPSASFSHEGFAWNWPNLGPMPGFQISKDYGKTWLDSPLSATEPLFPEPDHFLGTVKMGAPHFVDFGQNMEHSPDGKAYLVAMGSDTSCREPRPGIDQHDEATGLYSIKGPSSEAIQIELRAGEKASSDRAVYEKAFDEANGKPFDHGKLSWISADQIYLARVDPSVETINDLGSYEFFAGHDEKGQAIWSSNFSDLRPLLEWENNMGCVTITWVPGLKKYLMCVTDGWPTVAKMNSYILESDELTGPWKMVNYMKSFGEQAYFLNFPSKFISEDGRKLWLCYSTGFGEQGEKLPVNPPGGRYGMTLQEMTLS
jgi:hypothetical protein